MFRTKSFAEEFEDYYKQFPDAKYIGIHQFSTPLLMLRDPELIKRVTVKDFDSFMNHRKMLWLLLVAVTIAFACFHLYKNVNYWRDRNVTHIRPWPLLGNFTGTMFRTRSFPDDIQAYYKRYPDAKYIVKSRPSR
ncbi:Cytochrome P450 9f2 [Carabus blaptoides fortunei]